jgi:outer membrane biosynthesis protein TonB
MKMERKVTMPVDSLMPKKSKSSSGGFVAAAVVMLLLMGGLIFWKMRQNVPAPVLAAQSAPVETQQAPELEAPPPPPPPVEELDAGKDQKLDRTAKRAAPSGCDANCNGSASAQLRSALAGRGGQARGCYERVLRNNTGIEGRLLVSVTVGTQGQVCSARVTDQGLGDPAVANCVQRMFLSGTFPPPSGGCVNVDVPLNFVQKR